MPTPPNVLSIHVDKRADSMYVMLADKPVGYSQEIDADVIADFTEDGKLVGIDFQHISSSQRYRRETWPRWFLTRLRLTRRLFVETTHRIV